MSAPGLDRRATTGELGRTRIKKKDKAAKKDKKERAQTNLSGFSRAADRYDRALIAVF